MLRSLFALLLILVAVPLVTAALKGDPTIIESAVARMHGLYAGAILMIAGFIIGKFWSLKWKMKRTPIPAQERDQMDLFEPQKKA